MKSTCLTIFIYILSGVVFADSNYYCSHIYPGTIGQLPLKDCKKGDALKIIISKDYLKREAMYLQWEMGEYCEADGGYWKR